MSLGEERIMSLGKEDALRAYRIMKTIREFEERLHVEFETGEIPGFVHLYAGEEAVATGICIHLGPEDRIASTHRGHGHCIAKGCDVGGMMAEIYGKKSGLCGGKGGSMHICRFREGDDGCQRDCGRRSSACLRCRPGSKETRHKDCCRSQRWTRKTGPFVKVAPT